MRIRLLGGLIYMGIWAFVISFMAKGLCLHPVVGYVGFAIFIVASTIMTSPKNR